MFLNIGFCSWVKLGLLSFWGNRVNFRAVIDILLCAYTGYLNLKRIWQKELNLGELGFRKWRRKKSGEYGYQYHVMDLLLIIGNFLSASRSSHRPFYLIFYFTTSYLNASLCHKLASRQWFLYHFSCLTI